MKRIGWDLWSEKALFHKLKILFFNNFQIFETFFNSPPLWWFRYPKWILF